MYYPNLQALPRRKSNIRNFYGYEHLEKVRAGAFYDMKNLSSDKYPLLSARPDRLLYFQGRTDGEGGVTPIAITPDTPLTAAAAVNDTVVMCSGRRVYYYGGTVTDAELHPGAQNRKIIPFGRNFFVVPDGKYVITDETGAAEVRHAAFEQGLQHAAVGYADETGQQMETGRFRDAPPAAPNEGDIYTNVSDEGFTLMRYTGGAWQKVCDLYLVIYHDMAGHYALPGETLRVELRENDPFDAEVLRSEPGMLLLRYTGKPVDYETHFALIRKTMPVLDFAVEHENRIWGCRFGKNENGEFVNEIYASALGDPTVWYRCNGISTDSYTVSLGCPGAFTGAVVTGGELLFFKENALIRVSGSSPQDYAVSVIPARGVARGHGDTCVNLNEKIFYLSSAGVMVYDGALPYTISPEFSTHDFTDTLAFAYGGKYYLAAAENGLRRIYVYDTSAGLWHVEDDDFDVRFFLLIDSAVYMLCRVGETPPEYRFAVFSAGQVRSARNIMGPEDTELVCRFDPAPQKEWYAETGQLICAATAILRMLVFRLEMGEDAVFRAYLRCDDTGKWIPLCKVRRGGEAFSVPVNTPRCHSFALRLCGEGDITVSGISMITETTGEVRGLV